jgi:hypothetical protein
MDADPDSGAAGCTLHVGGVLLFGISALSTLGALVADDPVGLIAGGALAVTATVPVFFGVVLCRAGLRFPFRRAFTIRSMMTLIAVVAISLAFFVEVPLVVLTILGLVIAFWPVPVYIANDLDGPV